ncbi:MAG: TIR domain-containing protein [Bacteroidota bacterium]
MFLTILILNNLARRVYFSFHFDRDIIRVSQIRNCGVFSKEDTEPFMDKAEWEKIKQSGVQKIIDWINEQMDGTSVLVLCIGSETNSRKWVRHEIRKAHNEKKGIIGIRVHQQNNFKKETDHPGINPLSTMYDMIDGKEVYLNTLYTTYDWISNDGRANIQTWIEKAAQQAGR